MTTRGGNDKSVKDLKHISFLHFSEPSPLICNTLSYFNVLLLLFLRRLAYIFEKLCPKF